MPESHALWTSAEIEAAIADDPFVQQLMREFGGKIVPGSVRPV